MVPHGLAPRVKRLHRLAAFRLQVDLDDPEIRRVDAGDAAGLAEGDGAYGGHMLSRRLEPRRELAE